MQLDDRLGDARDTIVRRLNALGIGTSVHYPHPVPRMTYYRSKYGYDAAKYPGAERISDRSFALPVAPHVSDEDAAYIASTVSATLGEAAS